MYLLIDRHARECVLFTDPDDGRYATRHTVPFDKPVTLPFGGVLDTESF